MKLIHKVTSISSKTPFNKKDKGKCLKFDKINKLELSQPIWNSSINAREKPKFDLHKNLFYVYHKYKIDI